MKNNRKIDWSYTPRMSSKEKKMEERKREREREKLTALSAAIWDKYWQRLEEIKILREKIWRFPYRLALDNFTCGEWELKDKILSGLKIEERPGTDFQCQKMMEKDWDDRKKRQALEKKLDKIMAQSRRKEKR